jgi:hypothetical protein
LIDNAQTAGEGIAGLGARLARQLSIGEHTGQRLIAVALDRAVTARETFGSHIGRGDWRHIERDDRLALPPRMIK